MERRLEDLKNKSFEAFSVLLSLIILFGFVILGLMTQDSLSSIHRARWSMKVLAYSIWQLDMNKNSNDLGDKITKKRTLASFDKSTEEQGLVGEDPWGNPYKFRFKQNHRILYLWSIGPNGRDESLESPISFSGDDIGYILDLKVKR